MTEDQMKTLRELKAAGIHWELPWKASDDRTYVTRRAQHAAYEHNRNRKGA